MRKGWFDIPGMQSGDRTLEEQMKGLEPALAACKGKDVLDLGCAEGLIAIEFARAGAASVYGCDCNIESIAAAQALVVRPETRPKSRIRFRVENINERITEELASVDLWRYDIVLALAVLHKMHDPERATQYAGRATGERLVLRLPEGSSGVIQSKWGKHPTCDTAAVLRAEGLEMEQQLKGPRGELVQHWVRAGA